MTRLLFPLLLPPLALDGARQAERMRQLEEIASCRRHIRWEKFERETAERSTWNREIKLTNIDRSIAVARDDARVATARLREL